MFGHLPVVFDSASLAERDRFDFAREEYGRKALKVDLDVPQDAPFRLHMRAQEFGDVRVAVIQSTPYRVARTRPLIADGDDRIGLVFPLVGRFGGEQGRRDVTVGRGEATTMLADRTGWFGTATGGTFLTIRVPPALIASTEQDARHIQSGAVIRPVRLALDLLRSYLSAMNRSGSAAGRDTRDLAGRHLAELAAHAFNAVETTRAGPVDGEGLRAARANAAHSHMAAHFADPGYDLATCAGHLGISVRYLQVILEAAGTCFSSELRRLRLEHARALLSDPVYARLRIIDIALDCGFSDISHFNRQFKAHFGDTPIGLRGS